MRNKFLTTNFELFKPFYLVSINMMQMYLLITEHF